MAVGSWAGEQGPEAGQAGEEAEFQIKPVTIDLLRTRSLVTAQQPDPGRCTQYCRSSYLLPLLQWKPTNQSFSFQFILMKMSLESLFCIGSYFPNWVLTQTFRDDTKITVAIKAPLMAELKIRSPADTSLQEENIEFDLKEHIFFSLHVFCQRTPHLWQPCRQVTSVFWNEAPIDRPILPSASARGKF